MRSCWWSVPAAVLLSVEEYDGWQETLAIRDDPALVREIRHGLRALRRGAIDHQHTRKGAQDAKRNPDAD